MVNKTDFIKFGLCLMFLIVAVFMWVVFKSPLSFISGSLGLLLLIRFIYEYKTRKRDRYITMFGLGFILLLQGVLFWPYNLYLSFIFGLFGIIFLIIISYEYGTRKRIEIPDIPLGCEIMARNKIFIGLGLSLTMIFISILLWVIYNSLVSFIIGPWGFVFLIQSVYEYKTQKRDRFFVMFGLSFIILFNVVLWWIVYKSFLSIIFGVLGIILLIILLYKYKTQKEIKPLDIHCNEPSHWE